MSYWSKPGKIELLKKLWASGLPASAIARKLGEGATRNSVIGKSHRLQLDARSVSKRSPAQASTEKNIISQTKKQKLGRRERFKALLLDKRFPQENPTPISDLTDKHCRWPLGEKLQPANLFCGRPPVDKFPYCQLHLLYGYQSRNEKEEDVITEEDIPQFIEKKIKSA